MGAGVGEDENEEVVLVVIEKDPIGLDVAVAKSCEVAAERVVVTTGRKGTAFGEGADDGFELGGVFPAPEHPRKAFLEAGGGSDGVFHGRRNSESLSGSMQVGASGSLATALASRNAAARRSCVEGRASVKGISPVARHFLKKQVMAVVMFMPMSSKNSSASALSDSSTRMVIEVVIA